MIEATRIETAVRRGMSPPAWSYTGSGPETEVTIRLSLYVPSDRPDLLDWLGRFQQLIDALEQIPSVSVDHQIPSVSVDHEFNIRLPIQSKSPMPRS